MQKSSILSLILAAAVALLFFGCDVVASGTSPATPTATATASNSPTPAPTATPTTGATAYLFSSTGAADITSTIDNWSSGSTIDSAFTAETYNPSIKVSSGSGWGGSASAIAFTAIAKGKLAEFTTLKFKVKSTSYTQLSVKIPAVQKDAYLLSTGTTLTNGWVQMSIPLSDFGVATTIAASELGILNATGTGSFYITDVGLTGTAAVDVSPLTSAISAANTLSAAHTVGAANGNVPSAAKTAFTTAIATAQSVASGTPASMSVVIAAYNALATATANFSAAIIIIGPSTLPATPSLTANSVISLQNSSGTYTNISIGNWNPGWGQAGSLVDTTVAGKTIKWMNLANYQGVNISGPNGASTDTLPTPLNASGKTKLHISYWTADGTALSVDVINAAAENFLSAGTITTNAWTDLEITLPSGFDMTTLRQLKFTSEATPGNGIFVGGNFYLDNIYFH